MRGNKHFSKVMSFSHLVNKIEKSIITLSHILHSSLILSYNHFAIMFINIIDEMPAITLPSFCLQNEKSEQMKKVKKKVICVMME